MKGEGYGPLRLAAGDCRSAQDDATDGTCLYYVNTEWLMDLRATTTPFGTEAKEKAKNPKEKAAKKKLSKSVFDDAAKASDAGPILRL